MTIVAKTHFCEAYCGPFLVLVKIELYCDSATNKMEWVERETYGKLVLHHCILEK